MMTPEELNYAEQCMIRLQNFADNLCGSREPSDAHWSRITAQQEDELKLDIAMVTKMFVIMRGDHELMNRLEEMWKKQNPDATGTYRQAIERFLL